MRHVFLFFCSLFISAGVLRAQSATWTMDKAHSSVQFSVRHLVVSEVTGSFKDFVVTLASSKEDFSDAVVDGVIKVGSINTDNDRRDTHLKSDDFFNAEKFPEIRFKSVSFEKMADNKYKITGDLTIRDVTRRAVFDAVYGGTVKAWGKSLAAWKATTTINRFDYNLKWDKTIETGGLIVGQDVTITLHFEFNK